MAEFRFTEAEEKFAHIIWENEPIKSSELVIICKDEFSWKKSTTYTMLKRLEDKKIFLNCNSMVISLIRKEEFYSELGKIFLQENFQGSLSKFVASFIKRNKLSKNEFKELEELINNCIKE